MTARRNDPVEAGSRPGRPLRGPELTQRNPVGAAYLFLFALEDPHRFATALIRLTTPESLLAWGDFHPASRRLLAIADRSYAASADYPSPDVAYVGVVGATTEPALTPRTAALASSVVTLVHYRLRDVWLVHSMGAPILPERCPTPAPD